MSNDAIIPIINSFTMAFCVMAAVTWWPLARRGLCYIWTRSLPPKIYILALGIVWICIATLLVRFYSISIREFGMDFLRDHLVAPTLLLLQAIGFAVFGFGYMAPRESGKPNGGGLFWQGLAAGGATLAVLLTIVLW